MENKGLGVSLAVAIAASIIILDLLFFREQPFRRLIANIAVAGFYAALYFVLFKRR